MTARARNSLNVARCAGAEVGRQGQGAAGSGSSERSRAPGAGSALAFHSPFSGSAGHACTRYAADRSPVCRQCTAEPELAQTA